MNIKGATGILINFSGKDVSLNEVSDATRMIKEDADLDVNLIFGCTVDEQNLDDDMIRITVIATGFQNHENTQVDANHTKAPINVKPPEKTPQSPLGQSRTFMNVQQPQTSAIAQPSPQPQISNQNNYVNKAQPVINAPGMLNKTPVMIPGGIHQTFVQTPTHLGSPNLGLTNLNVGKSNPNMPYTQKTNFPVNNGIIPPNHMLNTPYMPSNPSYQQQQAYQAQVQQAQAQVQQPQSQFQAQFQAQAQAVQQASNQAKVQQQYVPMQPVADQNKGFNARNENVNSIRSKTPDVPNSDLSDNFWGEEQQELSSIQLSWSKKNN
jgi:hypothetical protein